MQKPLTEDTVFEGIIYLKGETEYPKSLEESLAQKTVVVAPASPIFTGGSAVPNSTTPTEDDEDESGNTPVQNTDDSIITGELPSDLPSRELFIASGYTTVDAIANLKSITEVDGIDGDAAKQVQNWFKNNYKKS